MKKNIVLLHLLLLLLGCGPQIIVHTDYDRDYDIRLYSRFNWAAEKNIEHNQNPLMYNELNDKRIKTVVNERLTNKGYKFSESDSEFQVHYHILIQDLAVANTEPFSHSTGQYWQQSTYRYMEGTIIVDLMEVKTNALIWRGWAVNTLDSERPELSEKNITAAITKIFADFPNTFE